MQAQYLHMAKQAVAKLTLCKDQVLIQVSLVWPFGTFLLTLRRSADICISCSHHKWLWWALGVDWFTEIYGSWFLIIIFYRGSKDLWCVALAELQLACVLSLFVWLLLFIILVHQNCWYIWVCHCQCSYRASMYNRKYNASIYTQELKRTFFFPYYMMYCDIVIQSNYGCRLKIGNFSSECPTWRSTMKRSMICWHQRIGSYNCMRALRYYWGTGPAPSISRVPKFVILQMCVLGAFYCRCVLDVWECSSQIAFSQSVWSAYWTQILCNL